MKSEATPQPNLQGQPAQLTPAMWALILLTGLGAGLTSGLLMKLLRFVQHLCFAYSSGSFLDGASRVSGLRRILILALAGAITAIVLWTVNRLLGEKGGDVTEAIWRREGNFDEGKSTVKAFLAIVIVGMGTALGREAALKDAGAVVASRLSAWGKLTPEQKKLLVACGAGAGMAAAYNVPLGGALFTAEVLLGSFAFAAVVPAAVASFLAVAVSWLMLPNEPTFSVPTMTVTSGLIVFAAFAGPLLGLASVAWVRLIAWAERKHPSGWLQPVLILLVFTGLGLVSVRFPEVLGNGKNVVQLCFSMQAGTGLLAWLLILRPLATSLCLKVGAPGGLFTPTMTFGALLGGLLGEGWSHVAAHTEKNSYAILGAGALLGAASQGPISSIVFLLELTDHVDPLIVPLMIVVAGASVTARLLEPRSIYSVRA